MAPRCSRGAITFWIDIAASNELASWEYRPKRKTSRSGQPFGAGTSPKCGSFEVRFPDGRESKYFCFDDVPGAGG